MGCKPCNPPDVDTFLREYARILVMSEGAAERYALRVIGRRVREGRSTMADEMLQSLLAHHPGGSTERVRDMIVAVRDNHPADPANDDSHVH